MKANLQWARSHNVAGARGTGKSSFIDKIIDISHFKNALILLQPVDLQDSQVKGKAYYKRPYLRNFYAYAGGVAKLCSTDMDISVLFTQISRYYRNGILVIDEASRYQLTWTNPNNQRVEPIPPLLDILLQCRKYNIELYFTYHSVSKMQPQLMPYINDLILFHQTMEMLPNWVPSKDEVKAAMRRCKEQYSKGNHYYNEVVTLA